MGRRIWALGVLLLATACGADAGEGVACTMIGTPVGVSVQVAHPDVVSGTIDVCYDGSCATPTLELHPSREIVETTCTGTSPDDSCGARTGPTEGTHGFVTVPDLPTRPVTVTLRLVDRSGSVVVDRRTEVTPEMAYPNGPHCPAGGPQARVSVGADGAVTGG